ncbi:GDP-mannose 4,6-dehydratase [Nocardia sp. NPDC057353]|uniref:GDP-mannose 4,6-dehydratase n=1 Tax=Nocardia sp. NPDC057353 TaxID=3346104 RepID=UPI0036392407
MTERALITGITGQDGSYLAEHLLEQGYEVWGVVRGQTEPRLPLAPHLAAHVRFARGDLLDQGSLISTVEKVAPTEVYNLGAISYVPLSWQQAEITAEVTGMGVLRILEAIRIVDGVRASRSASNSGIRFYQASSSEMFGKVRETPQNELTSFHPRSPYGVAKAYGHYITQNYRESYGMHASSGILFNHESPRRGPEFVTRKVTLGVARIKLGLASELRLGNLDAQRDWGFAGDYVRAMHLMVRQQAASDYVIGTGRMHTVREFVAAAFACVDLDWNDYVTVDPGLVRPAEVDLLCADYGKAHRELGWQPAMPFEELVASMVESDLQLLAPGVGAERTAL